MRDRCVWMVQPVHGDATAQHWRRPEMDRLSYGNPIDGVVPLQSLIDHWEARNDAEPAEDSSSGHCVAMHGWMRSEEEDIAQWDRIEALVEQTLTDLSGVRVVNSVDRMLDFRKDRKGMARDTQD